MTSNEWNSLTVKESEGPAYVVADVHPKADRNIFLINSFRLTPPRQVSVLIYLVMYCEKTVFFVAWVNSPSIVFC